LGIFLFLAHKWPFWRVDFSTSYICQKRLYALVSSLFIPFPKYVVGTGTWLFSLPCHFLICWTICMSVLLHREFHAIRITCACFTSEVAPP
jgi:hypothetical protein